MLPYIAYMDPMGIGFTVPLPSLIKNLYPDAAAPQKWLTVDPNVS